MNPTLETIKKGQEEFEKADLCDEQFGCDNSDCCNACCEDTVSLVKVQKWHTSFLISLFEGEVERLNEFVLPQVNLDLFEGKPLNDRNIVALAKATADGRQTDFVNDQIKHYQEIIDYLKSIV